MTNSKNLHPNNLHNQRYPLDQLIITNPQLKKFVFENKYGDLSINFSDPKAILELNKALLNYYYKIESWTIPTGSLCPPIPGRVDYIHYAADLISEEARLSESINALDIGTGTGCIYPLLGHKSYNWNFVATDINQKSLDFSREILERNSNLSSFIKLRHQSNSNNIFKNMILEGDYFHLTICNPPFHRSAEEALKGSQRKSKNLKKNKIKKGHKISSEISELNFGGNNAELWCDGGELTFISTMISESFEYKNQCLWFTTLVSKKANIQELQRKLKSYSPSRVKVIEMKQGQKIAHILAWSFS